MLDALTTLNQKISLCKLCELHKTRSKTVPGTGNPHADILFIGEAPGKNEDLQGKPFVGAAGKFLDEMLSNIGLERNDIFIGNVLKCRPPGNRDPKPEEVKLCWPYLEKQIKIIKPQIIITLGRHAMNRFLPELKISEAHGKPFSYKGIWQKKQVFYPLYHPAAALYNGGLRQTLIEDFNKIPQILKLLNQKNDIQSSKKIE